MRRPDARTAMVAAGAAVLLALYLGLVALARDYYSVSAPAASVYSRAPEGFQVFFDYLERIGADPRPLKTFDRLPAEGTIVVAADGPPERDPVPSESRRLVRWVRDGGRLVLFGASADDVSDLAGGGSARQEGVAGSHPLIMPAYFAPGVGRIAVGAERILLSRPEWVTHAKGAHGQVVVSRALGKGLIVWVSSTYPATNAGIGEEDDALFVTQLVAGKGPVWFDEYHHGFVDAPGPWALLGAGGRAGVTLIAAALVIVVAAGARRIGPAIDEPAEAAARRGAYIAPLAELYRKAGARAEALASLEDGLNRALARRYGARAAGLARHPEAARALEETSALRRRGSITEEEFVAAASRIRLARAGMEGLDG